MRFVIMYIKAYFACSTGVVYTEEEKISIKIAKAQQKQRQAKYMEYFLQLPVAEE